MKDTGKLQQQLMKLLDEYDYNYDEYALDAIIEEWNEQKEPLRAILRNHPRWVEDEDMIVFDINISREIDQEAIDNFHVWAIHNLGISYYDIDSESIWKSYHFPNKQFVTQEMLDRIKASYPDFKGAVGQKTSRAMNKLFGMLGLDKMPGYNREFAKYADALNPLVITRHTVLSVNLLDYLTMSFGNSWASCHTIDKKNKRGMPNNYSGCYSSGTLSYALDQTSMVFYTVDSKFNGTEYYFEPKINRQMFHFGEDKLVQARLYPQDCDNGADSEYTQFRNIVQEIIALGLGVPNLWTLKRGINACRGAITSHGTHYRDYYNYDNCTLSTLKDSENNNCMDVGAEPICIECGSRHDTSDNINCCEEELECYCCGRRISADDAIEYEGNDYCENCVTWCECCNRYVREEDARWIESEQCYVCDDCLDNNYAYCEYCGEYYNTDNMMYIDSVDQWVCDDCRCERFALCESCDEYYPLDDMHCDQTNFCYYCDDCWDDKQEEEEEEDYEDEAI